MKLKSLNKKQLSNLNKEEGISFSVTVGDGCWIGAGVKITGDTNIGKGSVIGTCALVNKNIQPNVVVAGIPAKIIRELEI